MVNYTQIDLLLKCQLWWMDGSSTIEGTNISLLLTILCYVLWLQRIALIYDEKRWSQLTLIHKFTNLLRECCLLDKFVHDPSCLFPHVKLFIAEESLMRRRFSIQPFSWKKSYMDRFKLNVDGSALGNLVSWGVDVFFMILMVISSFSLQRILDKIQTWRQKLLDCLLEYKNA
ncbi:hypothetical protein ACH5RR_029309 [Cinchona calisaya]|uniref:Uncharacterized protein n=1 Tax=Cinchona calisaya TaxID=153742 RepID=A0ABD2YRC7_9GENT